jgi:hypothetical protein
MLGMAARGLRALALAALGVALGCALGCGRSEIFPRYDTACGDASRWIYTLDTDTTLSRFDPVLLTFDDIARVNCPDSSGPNSMAVDMNGVAWAGYRSGHLFRIDTRDASCRSTTFTVGQHGMIVFGMEFLFDPMTSTDTLYVAGGPDLHTSASTLATIDMSSLVLTPAGPISIGFLELGATPDGQLWGFAPSSWSAAGAPILARIDPTNGKVLKSTSYSDIKTDGSFAMKFFNGGFFIFDSPSVYRVDLATGALTTEIDGLAHPELMRHPTGTPRRITGAGASRCPPL